jgi:hypothetical protein
VNLLIFASSAAAIGLLLMTSASRSSISLPVIDGFLAAAGVGDASEALSVSNRSSVGDRILHSVCGSKSFRC